MKCEPPHPSAAPLHHYLPPLPPPHPSHTTLSSQPSIQFQAHNMNPHPQVRKLFCLYPRKNKVSLWTSSRQALNWSALTATVALVAQPPALVAQPPLPEPPHPPLPSRLGCGLAVPAARSRGHPRAVAKAYEQVLPQPLVQAVCEQQDVHTHCGHHHRPRSVLPRSALELSWSALAVPPLELAGSALAGSPPELSAMADGLAPKRRPPLELAAGLRAESPAETTQTTIAPEPGMLAPEPGTLASPAPDQATTTMTHVAKRR